MTTWLQMIRTQIQFEPHQYQGLKQLAMRRSMSVSQVVRDAVDNVLSEPPDSEERWRRMFEVVGICESDDLQHDVSERHDHYLDEAYG